MEDPVRNCLGLRLGAAHRRMDRLLNRTFAAIGLTAADAQILICLLHAGELRVVDVAHRTGFEASTVSRLTLELNRRQLIHRREDPNDRRVRLLRPAKRAQALREEIRTLQAKVNQRLRCDLPDADLEGFWNTLQIIDRLP